MSEEYVEEGIKESTTSATSTSSSSTLSELSNSSSLNSSCLSSVAEEEYGNSLRVLTDAFVNFLEQAQRVNRLAARDNIKRNLSLC